MLLNSTGFLQYSTVDYGPKLILAIDQNISDYYFSLLPKYLYPNRQKYPAHVSVVRREKPLMSAWGLHEDERIEFEYTNEIFFGKVYCWINVFCKRLEEVRLELGLPVSSEYTRPPEGFVKCFHSTIANFK